MFIIYKFYIKSDRVKKGCEFLMSMRYLPGNVVPRLFFIRNMNYILSRIIAFNPPTIEKQLETFDNPSEVRKKLQKDGLELELRFVDPLTNRVNKVTGDIPGLYSVFEVQKSRSPLIGMAVVDNNGGTVALGYLKGRETYAGCRTLTGGKQVPIYEMNDSKRLVPKGSFPLLK